MRNKIACFICGLVLMALASCGTKPLCPAYSLNETTVEQTAETNS